MEWRGEPFGTTAISGAFRSALEKNMFRTGFDEQWQNTEREEGTIFVRLRTNLIVGV